MDRARLLEELKSFQPGDERETRSRDDIVAFIESEPDAFQRHLKKGHVTGSALLIGHGGEKVLLMHHRFLDKWLQFGGHADGCEDILDVALRETEEESGISELRVLGGIADVDVHAIPDRPERDEPAHFHYDIRYLLYTDRVDFTMGDGGVKELAWRKMDEAMALCTDASLKRLIQKAIAYSDVIGSTRHA